LSVEKFVDAGSLDPIYFDASYYLVPDGKAGVDVYAVLREAIETTGRYALARVVISQRERTIAIRPMGGGLVAQTLHEDRDLNEAEPLFEDAGNIKTDPEMVKLATQLIDRQTGRYDAADVEDRYETRLRAMLEAKVKGLDIHAEDEAAAPPSNVVDLMAALRKSLGQMPDAAKAATAERPAPADDVVPRAKKTAAPKRAKAAAEDVRRQPALKLPIEGGKKTAAVEKAPKARLTEPTARGRRSA
jgi:DNA end-binding protein Ku